VVKKKDPTADEIRAAAVAPLPPVVEEASGPLPMPKLKARKKHRLIPRLGWVLIRKTSLDEEVTEAGVILNRDNVKLHQGVIEAVGSEVVGLGVNDRVLYSAFGMKLDDIELLTGDKNLFMIRQQEIYSLVIETDEFITTLPGQAAASADRVQA
jgi:Chaperonin 10 Kd subunit